MRNESFLRPLPLFPPISGIPSHWQSNNDRVRTNSKRRPSPPSFSPLLFCWTGSRRPDTGAIKSNVTGEPSSKTERRRERSKGFYDSLRKGTPVRGKRCLSKETARRGEAHKEAYYRLAVALDEDRVRRKRRSRPSNNKTFLHSSSRVGRHRGNDEAV